MKTSKKVLSRVKRKNRIRARITGTAERPRLSVYKSLNNNYAQLIDDLKGITLVSINDLKIKKGNKLERAKAIGLEIAKKAQEKKIGSCIFDRNGYKYHGRVKAIAEGAREGGLKF
jgi:large subunit ribosomal protein L18